VKLKSYFGTMLQAGGPSANPWRGIVMVIEQGHFDYIDYNGSGYNTILSVSQSTLITGQWNQVVITRATNSCSMFINGTKVTSQNNLVPYSKPQQAALRFGAGFNFDDSPFNFCPATFDTIHIYNRALSQSEVQTLYANEAVAVPPVLGVVVKTVRVNMMQLITGKMYQLQNASSLTSSWINIGGSFTATNSIGFQDVDIIGTEQGYFRLVESP
jgi:hypothetical protein